MRRPYRVCMTVDGLCRLLPGGGPEPVGGATCRVVWARSRAEAEERAAAELQLVLARQPLASGQITVHVCTVEPSLRVWRRVRQEPVTVFSRRPLPEPHLSHGHS